MGESFRQGYFGQLAAFEEGHTVDIDHRGGYVYFFQSRTAVEEFGTDGVETFGQVDFLQAAVVVVAKDALGKVGAAVGYDDRVEMVAGGEGIATD